MLKLILRAGRFPVLLISLLLLSGCYHGDPLPAPEGPWEVLGDAPQVHTDHNVTPTPIHP